MQVYLVSGTGYYVRNVHNKAVSFTNRSEMAHSFNEMPVAEYMEIKNHVEATLKCELETVIVH